MVLIAALTRVIEGANDKLLARALRAHVRRAHMRDFIKVMLATAANKFWITVLSGGRSGAFVQIYRLHLREGAGHRAPGATGELRPSRPTREERPAPPSG